MAARRLPIYLLLDVSGSMTGEPIEALKNGLSMLTSALSSEPQALESAYLSIITFESVAKQIVPLTDLISFQEPHLQAGGATALGSALELLCKKLDSEIIKNVGEDQKGDWKPLVFIITDGQPTDNWQNGAAEIRKRKATVIACAAGFQADIKILKQITDIVVELKSATQNDIAAFFKWVTQSVTYASKQIGSGKEELSGLNELPPPPPEIKIIP